ncbi:MAG: Crp/Fnr family transcriptional regulator [Burkholderiaceae bacterium]|jgi:CRP/FNR family transcriptional regulator, cyclic AMP receptor protein|nr:Crp/Fnr family transcriptional regulator [Burkholderiaceae bacterium]
MAILSNLDLVRRVPLFASLSPSQASMVADAVSKHRFKRGEALVKQGEKSGYLAIMLNGRARVLATDSKGREVILAHLNAGAHVGEMSLIDDKPHSASVVAEVQTDTLILGREAFLRCLTDSVPMAQAVMKGLVQRLRNADEKIESLALVDVYGRVARALMELGQPDSNGSFVTQSRVSRQDVAKMIGASREMVSRVMKEFETRGLIATQPDGTLVVKGRILSL